MEMKLEPYYWQRAIPPQDHSSMTLLDHRTDKSTENAIELIVTTNWIELNRNDENDEND